MQSKCDFMASLNFNLYLGGFKFDVMGFVA